MKKEHELEVNPDPEPSSSVLLDTSSSDSRAKKKKSKKKSIVSIGEMTHQTYLQATTLILLMTVIIDAGDAKMRNSGKRIRSNNVQL